MNLTEDVAISSRLPKDCLITAMQAYARVKEVSPWAAIMYFQFTNESYGHVVCMFEAPDGCLYYYDDTDGSVRMGEIPDRSPVKLLKHYIQESKMTTAVKPNFLALHE